MTYVEDLIQRCAKSTGAPVAKVAAAWARMEARRMKDWPDKSKEVTNGTYHFDSLDAGTIQ